MSAEIARITPGPWTLVRHNAADHEPMDAPGEDWTIRGADGGAICIEGTGYQPGDPYVLAAAPDLLAALKGVLRVADRATVEFDAARAAIAKAEGGVLASIGVQA